MENKYVCSVDIGGTKIATAIMEYPADGSVPHPVFEAEVPTEAPGGRRGRLPAYRGVHQGCSRGESRCRGPLASVSVPPASSIPRRAPSRMPTRSCPAGPAFSWGRVCARTSVFRCRCGRRAGSCSGRGPLGRRQGQVLRLVPGHRHGHRRRICRERPRDAGASMVLPVIWATSSARLPPAFPCACGRSGHLESVASGTSIGRMYDERFGRVDFSRPSVGRDVNDLCRAGDAKATEVIHDAGFALGASLGSLANILDPEVIVLSGGVIHQRSRLAFADVEGFGARGLCQPGARSLQNTHHPHRFSGGRCSAHRCR